MRAGGARGFGAPQAGQAGVAEGPRCAPRAARIASCTASLREALTRDRRTLRDRLVTAGRISAFGPPFGFLSNTARVPFFLLD
ncbi:hypothetical protein WS72_23815 [Burkholderia savannae]|uniref:Uncharacterized protein n=1 Tax=Burkholderia savannae TaxID=1637837 RepID=A0ABR5T3X7_9BURK|nr:hypothetical protein WS72_23815 [Burkholderia savannae]